MSDFEIFLNSTASTLRVPTENDDILECGPDSLGLLAVDLEASLRLANDKLHVFPFKDVKTCWRRLYADARILLAVRAARDALGLPHHLSKTADSSSAPNSEPCGVLSESQRSRSHDHKSGQQAFPAQLGGIKRKAEESDRLSIDDDAELKLRGSTISTKRLRIDEQAWLTTCVEHLDMALIITGGCMRTDLIETFLSHLRKFCDIQHTLEGLPSSFQDVPIPPPQLEYPVARHKHMSLLRFQSHLQSVPLEPIVIESSMDSWEALHSRPWSKPSYLLSSTLGGRRLVPIELGRSYTDDDWGQAIVPFGEFLRKFVVQSIHKADSQKCGKDGEESETQTGGGEMAYLAQHDLFMQIPSLRNDVCVPDYCYTDPPPPVQGTPLARKAANGEIPKLDEPQLNAWFGPAGTISPLHTDPYHNILCQVVGQKYVRLYSPAETERLRPRGDESGIDMSNTSSVPTEVVEMGSMVADDPEKWEQFEEAQYYETILGPGECLYIPVGWWHYVRSLTISFSVSFWWN